MVKFLGYYIHITSITEITKLLVFVHFFETLPLMKRSNFYKKNTTNLISDEEIVDI
jgi:hypothetical protein